MYLNQKCPICKQYKMVDHSDKEYRKFICENSDCEKIALFFSAKGKSFNYPRLNKIILAVVSIFDAFPKSEMIMDPDFKFLSKQKAEAYVINLINEESKRLDKYKVFL